MTKICGFIVVRRVTHAFRAGVRPNLEIIGKAYHGIDRFRWEDLELAHYEKRLSITLKPIWDKLVGQSNGIDNLEFVKDFEEAYQAYLFSGPDSSELIAIWSPEIEAESGLVQSKTHLEFLGIDCFAVGEWSIILAGPFAHPQCFKESVSQLNRWGLLASADDCRSLFERYVQQAKSENVEPLMENPELLSIDVYRVSL